MSSAEKSINEQSTHQTVCLAACFAVHVGEGRIDRLTLEQWLDIGGVSSIEATQHIDIAHHLDESLSPHSRNDMRGAPSVSYSWFLIGSRESSTL